jgi:hypothetical protein
LAASTALLAIASAHAVGQRIATGSAPHGALLRDCLVRISRSAKHWTWALAVCTLAVLAAAEFYSCVCCCNNDFLWHREFGITFLCDEVYHDFGHHYLPARAMIDAGTAWLPYRVDRAIWFLATCAGLSWCVRFWSRVGMSAAHRWRMAAFVAVAATGCYIHRDLRECGLQLFLLILLTIALSALMRGRPTLTGMSLGLAAVYKVTPLIFLPYLIWKRQWRAAGWMAASGCFFCLLPAMFLGWQRNLELHGKWLAFASHTLAADDPSENGVEPPSPRNQSLPLLMARLVQHYPAGHRLHGDGRRLLQLASLEPAAAKRVVSVVMLSLAVALAWRFRKGIDVDCGDQDIAAEWGAMCILVALLSPLCWLQHLVLVIPAALLIAQRAAAGRAQPWQWAAASLAAGLILLVHRDLLGSAMCDLLSSLAPHTVASLLLGLAALGSPVPEHAAKPWASPSTSRVTPLSSGSQRRAARGRVLRR